MIKYWAIPETLNIEHKEWILNLCFKVKNKLIRDDEFFFAWREINVKEKHLWNFSNGTSQFK